MAMPTMLLTYKYRLNPEKRQHRALERILEQQRQLYNAALEERIEAYRRCGRSISEVDQSRSLTIIRADDPAFAGVQRRIQRATLKRLDRAYKAFFRRAKAGAGASSGFPKFKGREHFDGFAFDAFAQIVFADNGLRFSGMSGKLRVHVDRPLPEVPDSETGELEPSIKNIWFKRVAGKACSRWYCGFQVEIARRETRAGLGTAAIGVDWGTSVLAALSSGEMVPNPRHGEALPLFGYPSRYEMYKTLKRAAKKAKVEFLSPHKIGRHAFAARYLRDGNSLAALKRAGGWNSLGAVAVYAHLEQDSVDESVRSVTTPLSGVAHSAQRNGKDAIPEMQVVGNAA
jgi:transposase